MNKNQLRVHSYFKLKKEKPDKRLDIYIYMVFTNLVADVRLHLFDRERSKYFS
jgi:hypothetical protein